MIGLIIGVGAGSASAAIGTNDYPSNLASAGPDTVVDRWGFYNRECVSFVAWRLNNDNGMAFSNNMSVNGTQGHFGYAYQWKDNAVALFGASVFNVTPTTGSVAWWGVSNYTPSGHVAYVDSVNADGSINIEQYNALGSHAWSSQTLTPSDPHFPNGFLHLKDLATNTRTYKAAFQSNDGNFYLYNPSSGATNTTLGMQSGTSPAVKTLANGGYQAAFQSNQGQLWLYGSASTTNTQLGMISTSSPSIDGLSGGGYEVAFQSNQGQLWVYGNAGSFNTALGMMPTTSPSIAGLSNGSYTVAFSAWQSGSLYLYNPSSGATNTTLGVMHDTSPSVVSYTVGGYEVAFQASGSGNLYLYNPATGATNTGLGMMPGSSPSITHLSDGSYEVAFQANDGSLYLYNPSTGATNLQLGMMPGSSPSIVGLSGGGYEVTFQDNQGNLWVYGAISTGNTLLGMKSNTSPSVG